MFQRDDGRKQWALVGKPLYYWSKDARPGDMSGDMMNNGQWHVFRVLPRAPHADVPRRAGAALLGPARTRQHVAAGARTGAPRLAQQQVFHECLLHVHAVFGLVPDHGLRGHRSLRR